MAFEPYIPQKGNDALGQKQARLTASGDVSISKSLAEKIGLTEDNPYVCVLIDKSNCRVALKRAGEEDPATLKAKANFHRFNVRLAGAIGELGKSRPNRPITIDVEDKSRDGLLIFLLGDLPQHRTTKQRRAAADRGEL